MTIDYTALHIKSKSRRESEFIAFMQQHERKDIIRYENYLDYGWLVNGLIVSLIFFDFSQPGKDHAYHSEEDLQIIERVIENIYAQFGKNASEVFERINMNLNRSIARLQEHITKGNQK